LIDRLRTQLRDGRVARGLRRRQRSRSYEEWLDCRLRVRSRTSEKGLDAAGFSVLTTVFDTPPDFLREVAASVFGQTHHVFEWILLDNGSTRGDVVATLNDIARDSRVQYLRVEENLGIVGGMRRCLDTARQDYVVPVDSDDVLLPDALALLAKEISRHPSAAFVYTDEDVLRDGRIESPYLRPDWDPVLNICTSYIFHLCAFRRDDALRLGVYSDDAATWCHDWDTAQRFAAGGREIVHVPEVAYHWRSHAQSSTHRASPERGSLESQRHLLTKMLAAHELGELFEVQLFPINRGLPELWVRRRRERPEAIDVVLLANDDTAESSIDRLMMTANYPFRNVALVEAMSPRDIARAVSGDESLTLVYTDSISPEGDEWPWEAQGLAELHPDVVLVSGRVVNRDRIVVAGGEILGFHGLVGVPDRGRSEDDPGYYALALKQRSVSACNSAFFVARAGFLREVLASLPPDATLGFLGAWLGAAALSAGKRVVFSPLITASAERVVTGEQRAAAHEAEQFVARYGHLIPDVRWYSHHFSRDHAYQLESFPS
jgi:glycosyltransferase involved in cell wall biosynthesis